MSCNQNMILNVFLIFYDITSNATFKRVPTCSTLAQECEFANRRHQAGTR